MFLAAFTQLALAAIFVVTHVGVAAMSSAILGAALVSKRHVNRGLLIGAVSGALLLLVLGTYLTVHMTSGESLSLSDARVVHLYLLIPTALYLAVLISWEIRHTPKTTERLCRLRSRARWSVPPLAVFMVSAAWFYWNLSLGAYGDENSFMLCAAAMPPAIVLASIPWIARGRRPEGAFGQSYGHLDKVAKRMLQIAGLVGPASSIVAVLIGAGGFVFERQIGLGVLVLWVSAICIGGIGNLMAGILFLVGLAIESLRQCWHMGWTIWGGLYFGGWLILPLGAASYAFLAGW